MSAQLKDTVLPGDPLIPLTLRRSARAKRITLRISQLDGRVTLTLPRRLPEREALAFARSKEGWIRKHLAARAVDVDVQIGAEIPVAGRPHQIISGDGRQIRCGGATVSVPGPAERVGRRLSGYLKEMARDRLAEACDRYSTRLGKDYTKLTLRDTRSRWGSCTSEGGLMFSWRLIMAPPEILEYVAAHEVAHLVEMNHSPAFWSEVERLYGPYKDARQWLRTSGNALHRYRF